MLVRFEEYLLKKLKPWDVFKEDKSGAYLFNVNQTAYVIERSSTDDAKRVTRMRVNAALASGDIKTVPRKPPKCSQDVPFAKLDAILLLAKLHLKGDLPKVMNQKDNMIFIDYLAGGQCRKIALERLANAASNSPLAVAARNFQQQEQLQQQACTVPAAQLLTGQAAVDAGPSVSMLEEVKVVSKEAVVLASSLKEAVGSYRDLMKAKRKGHAEELNHKKEMMEVEDECHKAVLARIREESEERLAGIREESNERLKNKRSHWDLDKEIEAERLELESRKLDIEERRIRLNNEQMNAAEATSVARPLPRASAPSEPPSSPLASIHPPRDSISPPPLINMDMSEQDDEDEDDEGAGASSMGMVIRRIVAERQVPNTLDELSTFFEAARDSDAQMTLNRFRKTLYERVLSERLKKFQDEEAQGLQAMLATSASRPQAVRSALKETCQRIQHYCHLVFWTYVSRMLLPSEERVGILGAGFRTCVPESESVMEALNKNFAVNWSNVDEKLFGLPVDAGNIPLCASRVGVSGAAIDAVQGNTQYAKAKRRAMLWKLKMQVASALCTAAQEKFIL